MYMQAHAKFSIDRQWHCIIAQELSARVQYLLTVCMYTCKYTKMVIQYLQTDTLLYICIFVPLRKSLFLYHQLRDIASYLLHLCLNNKGKPGQKTAYQGIWS